MQLLPFISLSNPYSGKEQKLSPLWNLKTTPNRYEPIFHPKVSLSVPPKTLSLAKNTNAKDIYRRYTNFMTYTIGIIHVFYKSYISEMKL